MLQVPTSPVPSISISFAPHELPLVEPKSPFTATLAQEPVSPCQRHLLSPPLLSPIHSLRKERHGQLSPLSSSESSDGKGLERERFEAMLKAFKERSAMVGAKKPVELRKEIAMKVQKAKQCERRARFLSKLVAPPSPTAADLPVTPPDSPAVFHFSLPSPGLISPLELFEDLANHPEMYDFKATIEQVDFRVPAHKQVTEMTRQRRVAAGRNVPTKPLPSLDQISKRMSRSPTPITTSRSPSLQHGCTASNRLPSFLRSRMSPSSGMAAEPSAPVLPLPEADAPKLHNPAVPVLVLSPAEPIGVASRASTTIAIPQSPKSPRRTKLQITTTICPPTRSKGSPTEFTEANISEFGTAHSAVAKTAVAPSVGFNSQARRVQASRDLLSKLSRRTSRLPDAKAFGVRAQDDTSPALSPSTVTEDKIKRRLTAPAEMSPAQRGTRHAVLDKPGGF